jgi:DUF4097 and DUF4098 domain-containing protein YvlB
MGWNNPGAAIVSLLRSAAVRLQEGIPMNLRKASVLLLAGALPVVLSSCKNHHRYYDDGTVRAKSDSGEVSIAKMGGGIDVEDAPQGATLSTMGGGIHVGNVAVFAKVKTMGGGIDIDHSTGIVDASTMGGGITIDTANGPIKATTMGGDIKVRETGSSTTERDIELTSKGGTIELTVPKDFPMDVRITLAYTNSYRDYHIEQHAGLEVRESSEWDTSDGTPRKYIRAAGQVGNGLNQVTIKTINGNVILRQE